MTATPQSEPNKPVRWSEWLENTVEAPQGAEGAGFSAGHRKIAHTLIAKGAVQRGQRALDVGAGTGLLAFTIAAQYGAQVHWYEAHGIAKRKFKIKRFLEETP